MTLLTNGHHILMVVLPTWGHIRPALAIVAKLLSANPELIITYPILASLQIEIQAELTKVLFNQNDALERVRFPRFGQPNDSVTITSARTIVEGFRGFYSQISISAPYQDSIGQTIPATSPPKICLLDVSVTLGNEPEVFKIQSSPPPTFQLFASECLRIIREINNIPCLAMSFGSAAILIRRSCPAQYSGLGDTIENVERLAIETEQSVDDILFKAYNRDEGEIIHIPGLPPMFDYEFTPETSPFLKSISLMLRRYHATFQKCDGLILTSNQVYERESTNFLRSFVEKTNRPCYILGLAGSISSEQASQARRSSANKVVVDILERTLKNYGQRSLIYVSFGSVFWPTNVEASWKILEIIVELNIPMILSYNEKRVPMPQHISNLLRSSDNVAVTSWAPQEMILNHASIGWFLTHCGLNSVMESLSHGVPMIAWPIDSDQPVNAAHISLNLDVAYELLEVRTSRGLKPLYRGAQPIGTMEAIEREFRTVLTNAFGEDGKVKRRNAELLKEKLNQLWDDDGESTSELRRFINDYFPLS